MGIKWARMELLRPSQLLEFTRDNSIVFVPAGIYEWHEAQNPMGTDTLKMQEIAFRTARLTGGVVHMPVYTGVGAFYGQTEALPHGGINFEEEFVKEYLLKLCRQLESLGFQLIVLLYGHTNQGNINAYEGAADEYMRIGDTKAKVVAFNDVNPAVKYRYKYKDHAAKWETSFMMAAHPEAICMEEIDPAHGEWWGLDPSIHASPAEGERMYSLIAMELARLVNAAVVLSREEITTLNFASRAGFGDQPCWAACQNIEDLRTGYWKGDLPWEDPYCPICAWRSPGVIKALIDIKGWEWMQNLANHWSSFLTIEYKFKTGSSIKEILTEWEVQNQWASTQHIF
jgi:creatinine amidohydrolase/Fe(II)-dependent formamide hydrolase-like protein